jgi:hypothetical protein
MREHKATAFIEPARRIQGARPQENLGGAAEVQGNHRGVARIKRDAGRPGPRAAKVSDSATALRGLRRRRGMR